MDAVYFAFNRYVPVEVVLVSYTLQMTALQTTTKNLALTFLLIYKKHLKKKKKTEVKWNNNPLHCKMSPTPPTRSGP